MRKYILLLILIAAPVAALLAQPETYVMRVETDIYIPNDGVVSLWGGTDSTTSGGGLVFGDGDATNGSANCGGVIITRGDFDNRNQVGTNPFVLAQPPELQEGTLRMEGTEDEFIRGNETTFFNLVVLNSKKILADNDAFVDVVDTFTIGEGVEFSTEDHQMVIQNSDTAAIQPLHPDNAFVSSTGGDPNVDLNPTTDGGRLVWRTENNAGVIYRFPVGAAGLPGFPRRDVEIATTTDEERHILARCVAKDPNTDGWEVNADEDTTVCYTNERYYHIVDIQQPRGTIENTRFDTTAHFAIRYAAADGQFDALGHYDRIEPDELLIIGWRDTEAELEDKLVNGQAQSYGTVEGWSNFEAPVFAFIARKPIRGIYTDVARSIPLRYGDRSTPGQIIVSLDSLLSYFTDEQNTDKFDYSWTMTDQLPPNEVVWSSSERHPEDVLGQAEFLPGYYDLNLTITNPAAPTACRAESNLLVLINPSRVYYLPDAFSPNGDDVNQTFYAYFYGFEQAKIQIFNRWGVMIFDETYAPNEAIEGPERVELWDGYDQGSGQPCPEGVYVFKLEVISSDPNALRNKVWEETGTVTLIR